MPQFLRTNNNDSNQRHIVNLVVQSCMRLNSVGSNGPEDVEIVLLTTAHCTDNSVVLLYITCTPSMIFRRSFLFIESLHDWVNPSGHHEGYFALLGRGGVSHVNFGSG